jgi:hypothetical protein
MLYVALTAYLIILVAQPHGAPLKMVEEYPSLDACHEAVIKGKIRVPHGYYTTRCTEYPDQGPYEGRTLRNQDPVPLIH